MKKIIITIITTTLIACSMTYKKTSGETNFKIEICKNPEICKKIGEKLND